MLSHLCSFAFFLIQQMCCNAVLVSTRSCAVTSSCSSAGRLGSCRQKQRASLLVVSVLAHDPPDLQRIDLSKSSRFYEGVPENSLGKLSERITHHAHRPNQFPRRLWLGEALKKAGKAQDQFLFSVRSIGTLSLPPAKKQNKKKKTHGL